MFNHNLLSLVMGVQWRQGVMQFCGLFERARFPGVPGKRLLTCSRFVSDRSCVEAVNQSDSINVSHPNHWKIQQQLTFALALPGTRCCHALLVWFEWRQFFMSYNKQNGIKMFVHFCVTSHDSHHSYGLAFLLVNHIPNTARDVWYAPDWCPTILELKL